MNRILLPSPEISQLYIQNKNMLSGSFFNLAHHEQKNWCCNTDYNRESQIVGYRKNIIPKSAQKKQQKQKTSLKKRSDTVESDNQPKKEPQPQPHPPKYDNTPPKPAHITRQARPPDPVLVHHVQMVPAQPSTVNSIRYTPEKPRNPERRINFVYNNKTPSTKLENLGVNDLQSFQQPMYAKKQNLQIKNTNFTTAVNSQAKINPYKSTQHTVVASEKAPSWMQSPSLSQNFQKEAVNPLVFSERKDRKDNIISLSSRKETVLSIDGDSESQLSIEMGELQPLSFPLVRYTSNQQNRGPDEKDKIGHSSLKTSIYF